VIAAGPAMMPARDNTIAQNEHGSDGWIRACCSRSLFRFDQGDSHKFFVGTLLRHKVKVGDQTH